MTTKNEESKNYRPNSVVIPLFFTVVSSTGPHFLMFFWNMELFLSATCLEIVWENVNKISLG
jgi:hypothetical protein